RRRMWVFGASAPRPPWFQPEPPIELLSESGMPEPAKQSAPRPWLRKSRPLGGVRGHPWGGSVGPLGSDDRAGAEDEDDNDGSRKCVPLDRRGTADVGLLEHRSAGARDGRGTRQRRNGHVDGRDR